MFEEQNRIVDVELENISKTKNGKVGRVWAIRKKIIGRKKVDMLPSAISDQATKKLVVNTTNIKETVLRYCVETLSNNEPEERFKEEIVKKKEYVTNRLDMNDGNFEGTIETFEGSIKKFKISRIFFL